MILAIYKRFSRKSDPVSVPDLIVFFCSPSNGNGFNQSMLPLDLWMRVVGWNPPIEERRQIRRFMEVSEAGLEASPEIEVSCRIFGRRLESSRESGTITHSWIRAVEIGSISISLSSRARVREVSGPARLVGVIGLGSQRELRHARY